MRSLAPTRWQSLLLGICLVSCSHRELATHRAADSGEARTTALRIAVVAELQGVLEPCGCTRTSRGGMDKVAHAIRELREDGAPLLLIGAGNLFATSGPVEAVTPHDQLAAEPDVQARLKADAMAAVLRRLRMEVVVPGAADRKHAARELVSLGASGGPQLLGKAAVGGEGLIWSSGFTRQLGPQRVALVALEDPPPPQQLKELRASASLLVCVTNEAATVPSLEQQTTALACDLSLSTGHGAERVHGDGLPSVAVGAQALTVLTIGPKPPAGRRWRLAADAALPPETGTVQVEQRLLAGHAASDPDVRKLLDQLFARLNLEARQRADEPPPARDGASFVGARTCAACHTAAYVWWQQTRHGRAYQTLIARSRELDLDCVGCHVTGFEQPGGSTLGALDELQNVGCESCHGPGGRHVDDPRVRTGTVRREVAEATCLGCHDPSHSEGFEFGVRRRALLGEGHGQPR